MISGPHASAADVVLRNTSSASQASLPNGKASLPTAANPPSDATLVSQVDAAAVSDAEQRVQQPRAIVEPASVEDAAPPNAGEVAVASEIAAPDDTLALLPVRMLNEFTYCPRLGYLEW